MSSALSTSKTSEPIGESEYDGKPEPVARRRTRQRSLIWEVLARANGGHLSVAEVEMAVRTSGPPLHRATIYRTLDRLVADGLLIRTNLGSDRSQYEIALHHHHHLVCGECGHVEHVPHEIVCGAIRRIEDDSGFDLAEASVSLHGRCRGCQDS
jgi:Fur family ferric uptake transcriptional regulator